jgi:hypothetical protein
MKYTHTAQSAQLSPATRTTGGATVPIFFHPKGKPKPIVVGHVLTDDNGLRVFSKRISGSRHMLHTPKSICLGEPSLLDAIRHGATHARITDSETGAIYQASFDDIRRLDYVIERAGFERQFALPLDKWTRLDQRQQLTLWGAT